MDLSDVFLNEMYIGFCAATRELVERHHIHAWSFSNLNFYADDNLVTSDLPNFIPLAPQSIDNSRRHLIFSHSVAAMVLLMSILAATRVWMAVFHRTRKIQGNKEETNEEEAKQFVVEVCTLGRLKHRYLVGLRGWCRFR
ncbi:hypothetical protein OPV22_017738 [Ensete ventricosum]|uniref:Legume lectin domain-containing protein n=1 Tax=Ensete ventricosum TaxID=4639 RepID=A0AAV8R2X8_ENSVE|nr:hypothetical protein OPV22_017738 [Ensete ventricosum]